ncbi:carcinoembryonic antigen-related cell adhesion molecule 1-like isoform X2 [Amblyraja radiata]|nr:carcinoembryonic antigen-related cell adhesion molecule 1-like isoform X2 [Amblyraja radiata]
MCKSFNIQLVNGLEGTNVTFPFTRPAKTDEILFTFEDNKVLEWEFDRNISYFGKFSERANLIGNTIMIKNLLLNDSGIYKLSFTSTTGSVVEEIYQLVVNVPLSKPTISCVANDSIIHLNCSVNKPVKKEWKHENSTVQQGEHFDLTPEGTNLAILNPKESSGEYTCIVRQPGELVQSDPFNIKECFKNEEGRDHILLAIAIIPIILVIVAVLCWCKFKRKYSPSLLS